jgi:hypothetical protein
MNITHYNLTNQFWNGQDKNRNQLKIDKDGIRYCLLRALNDFTSRTETRKYNSLLDRGIDTPLGPNEMLTDL